MEQKKKYGPAIGYRFTCSDDGDVYFIKLKAYHWRMHIALDYDTLDYEVLSIVNGRTLEKVDEIEGFARMNRKVWYIVGQRVTLSPGTKYGTFFFKDFRMLFLTYVRNDENAIPYWDNKEFEKNYYKATKLRPDEYPRIRAIFNALNS